MYKHKNTIQQSAMNSPTTYDKPQGTLKPATGTLNQSVRCNSMVHN